MNYIRNARIRIKVAFAPVTTLLLLLLVALLAIGSVRVLTSSLGAVQREALPALAMANSLKSRLAAVKSEVNATLAWVGAEAPEARIADMDKRVLAQLEEIANDLRAAQ